MARHYALLFSGMSAKNNRNDLEFFYRTLIAYDYDRADIQVLNKDGSQPQPSEIWPGNSSAFKMKVGAPGTRQALLDAFKDLRQKLKPQDSLLIHTNNHGAHFNGQSHLFCYPNWDVFSAGEFKQALSQLPHFHSLIVVMQQCHSGGFKAATLTNGRSNRTSFASACGENSYSMAGADFCPFTRDWISAMRGAEPSGLAVDADANIDGVVTAREAFQYADGQYVGDTPQPPDYGQAGNGDACTLGA